MLTEDGEMLEHRNLELKAQFASVPDIDERLMALVQLLGRSAAARDHALQLKIEKAAENQSQKGNS